MVMQDNQFEDKNKYIDLRDYLTSVVKQLDECIDKLNLVIKYVNNCYTINGEFEKNGVVEEKRESLIKIRDDITNIVIPQLDDIVNNFNQ